MKISTFEIMPFPFKTFWFWFMIVGLLFMIYGVVLHEEVHMIIINDHGVHGEYDWWNGFGKASVKYYGDCGELCDFANQMNEAITYNFQDTKMILYLAFTILIFFFERNYYLKKWMIREGYYDKN